MSPLRNAAIRCERCQQELFYTFGTPPGIEPDLNKAALAVYNRSLTPGTPPAWIEPGSSLGHVCPSSSFFGGHQFTNSRHNITLGEITKP